jgi:signal transduction histidine kinase
MTAGRFPMPRRPAALRRPATLRRRLLAGAAAATAAILAASGLTLYGFVRTALLSEFDAALASSAAVLAGMTEQDGGRVTVDPEAADLPQYARGDAPDYFAAWADDGRPAGASTPAALARPAVPPAPGPGVVGYVTLPDGRPGRRVDLAFVPSGEHGPHAGETRPPPAGGGHLVTLSVARHTADLDSRLGRLAGLLAAVGVAATAAATLVMAVVVTRGLRPLSALASRIESVGPDSLDARVELRGVPGELSAVVNRLNDLLGRLQVAVDRERRFTADVAHELRTPLAGLEATIDVCAARDRSPADYARTLDACGRIVRGMHAMTESLLTLARADARRLPVDAAPVLVGPLLRECWAAFDGTAAARGLTVGFAVAGELAATADARLLRVVINNLLDNAVTHANAGGFVRVVAAAEGDGRVSVAVTNSGAVLGAGDVERVFDRFWRGDAARRDTGLHCGLGLSLCREIVGLLAGAIAVRVDPAGLFEARVTLRQARDALSAVGQPPHS